MSLQKKLFVIVAGVVFAGLLLYFTKDKLSSLNVFKQPDDFVAKKFPQADDKDVEHKWEIKISGSEPVLSVMMALAAEFEREHENIKITFPPATHSRRRSSSPLATTSRGTGRTPT